MLISWITLILALDVVFQVKITLVKAEVLNVDEAYAIVEIGKYPFFVSVRHIMLKTHICGAIIITSSYIFSPCHCFKNEVRGEIEFADIEHFQVVAGTDHTFARGGMGVQTRMVEMVIPHNKCEFTNMDTFIDIAFMKMAFPFKFNLRIKPWKPPYKDKNEFENFLQDQIKKKCYMVYWMYIKHHFPAYPYLSNRFIISVNAYKLDKEDCINVLCVMAQDVPGNCTNEINDNTICFMADGKSHLRENALAGFLVCDGEFIGSKSCSVPALCQLENAPDIFVTVDRFITEVLTFSSSFKFSTNKEITFIQLILCLITSQ